MPFSDLKPLTAKYVYQVWQKEWDETGLVSNKFHEKWQAYCINTVHEQYVLQYWSCWPALDSIQRALYTYTCSILLAVQSFTLRNAMHRQSRISLWSTRRVRQLSEKSAAGQPLIGVKRHTLTQFSDKMWLWQFLPLNCFVAVTSALI